MNLELLKLFNAINAKKEEVKKFLYRGQTWRGRSGKRRIKADAEQV